MDDFKRLSYENKIIVIGLYEFWIHRGYNEINRVVSEEQYDKSIQIKIKELKMFKRIVKIS